MFDLLLGITAAANAAVETMTVIAANVIGGIDKPSHLKSDYEKSLEFYKRRQVLNKYLIEDKAPSVRSMTPSEKSHRKYIEKEALRKVAQRKAMGMGNQKKNPFADWVVEHDEMLLSVLEPGIHLIPKRAYIGMDEQEIASWLFEKIKEVESVEITPEGLEVTAR